MYIWDSKTMRNSKDIVDNYRTMFESRISAVWIEKLPFPQNLRISSWSYDMEGHAKKWVERYCELSNKTTQQLYKVSTLCIDDHHFKEEELKSVGELSQVCSQIVQKCLYLARIGRPDILLEHYCEKVQNWECLFVNWEKELFLSVYVDDIKLAGKKQNSDPMWKVLKEEVDLGEPKSFLDHVYLGCTQWECETSKDAVDSHRTMFESISVGGTEKLLCSENLVFLRGPMIWKVMPRNVWNGIASSPTKQLSNCTKLQLHALMTINSKKRNWDLLENWQKYALEFFWNACTWHALVDQTFNGQ